MLTRVLEGVSGSLALPGRWSGLPVAEGRAAAEEPQLERSRGPLTTTGLVSACSSAAFRGLRPLKRTTDRQPVKPSEATRATSGSRPSDSAGKIRFKTSGRAGWG